MKSYTDTIEPKKVLQEIKNKILVGYHPVSLYESIRGEIELLESFLPDTITVEGFVEQCLKQYLTELRKKFASKFIEANFDNKVRDWLIAKVLVETDGNFAYIDILDKIQKMSRTELSKHKTKTVYMDNEEDCDEDYDS